MRIKRSGIYQITNLVNGNFYIGSSVDITNRWNHWKGSVKQGVKYTSLLRAAFVKYGIENFEFTILERCEPIKEVLQAREQHYIDTLNPYYNILKTAYSSAGHKYSEEIRARNAAIARERVLRDPDAFSARMSACAKEQWLNEAYRENALAHIQALARDPVVRAGSSAAGKARIEADPDCMTKLTEAARAANTGTPRSQETRDKIRASNAVSEKRLAYYESKRGVKRDPEIGRKTGATQRGQKRPSLQGKSSPTSMTGEYGVNWRSDQNCWMVRIKGKKYGNFKTMEEAMVRRDEVVAALNSLA